MTNPNLESLNDAINIAGQVSATEQRPAWVAINNLRITAAVEGYDDLENAITSIEHRYLRSLKWALDNLLFDLKDIDLDIYPQNVETRGTNELAGNQSETQTDDQQ